jgi:hypothetical protein
MSRFFLLEIDKESAFLISLLIKRFNLNNIIPDADKHLNDLDNR